MNRDLGFKALPGYKNWLRTRNHLKIFYVLNCPCLVVVIIFCSFSMSCSGENCRGIMADWFSATTWLHFLPQKKAESFAICPFGSSYCVYVASNFWMYVRSCASEHECVICFHTGDQLAGVSVLNLGPATYSFKEPVRAWVSVLGSGYAI